MLLILSIYFGTIYYFVKKVVELAQHYENTSEPLVSEAVDNFYLKEFDLDVVDPVVSSVISECVLINEDDNILVCCTGDRKSMALLNIMKCIYSNIHVLYLNHHNTSKLEIFIHDICDKNDFIFHS